jgi:hypothetical protein
MKNDKTPRTSVKEFNRQDTKTILDKPIPKPVGVLSYQMTPQNPRHLFRHTPAHKNPPTHTTSLIDTHPLNKRKL